MFRCLNELIYYTTLLAKLKKKSIIEKYEELSCFYLGNHQNRHYRLADSGAYQDFFIPALFCPGTKHGAEL